MTKYELNQKLTTALTDLYRVQSALEHAIHAGVPPDAKHVVQLNTVAKQLCSILAKLNEVEPDRLQESA